MRRAAEPYVFDKAKYHSGGDWPDDLDPDQAFVHTGIYVAWLIANGLLADSAFDDDHGRELQQNLLSRRVTGPQLFEQWFDGVLTDQELTDEGDRFSRAYFDFDKGSYLADYEELLVGELPDLYHVADTWSNYDVLASRLDQRLADWRQRRRPWRLRRRHD